MGPGTGFAHPVLEMRAPVRLSRGRPRYTGQVARRAFTAWADSPEGRRVLDRVASGIRFAPFGKVRAARGRVWRQLAEAARAETVAANVQRELDAYLPRIERLAYAPDLPRLNVELRRMIAVPRLLLNAETYRRLDLALQGQPVFAGTVEGRPLRDWFLLTLISSLEAAVIGARPSPWRPLPSGGDWITVGVNEQFEWRIPFECAAWPGHYYVLELRRIPITRAVRKAARDAIAGMEESLASLSGLQRTTMLRTAAETLE